MKNKIIFGTKAETLERLHPLLSKGKILEQVCFTFSTWKTRPSLVFEQLADKHWLDLSLIVRSSAKTEDSWGASHAGGYTTLLNIQGEASIQTAIEQVISSYEAQVSDEDQVLIQPMLNNVVVSGVVFTRDPSTSSPYITINYDSQSGRTDTVTSGNSNNLKTLVLHRKSSFESPQELSTLLETVKELESLCNYDCLDIEFAITESGDVYVLQVRPLIVRYKCAEDSIIDDVLEQIQDKFQQLNIYHPYLYGKRTIFGVMPDWNPAEIIGIKPRPLALSLYKELITDNIWAYQRDNYGYKNLRSFPLLISFAGLPYIDVRVSFNSFIPADLPDELAHKLADLYIDRLQQQPTLHDKVEFEIVYSCYTLDLPERLQKLELYGFLPTEIQVILKSLRQLTNNIINQDSGLWQKDRKKINILEHRRAEIINSEMNLPHRIYWLLEDCKRYGTLPFAGLARAGFIAVQMLRSLVSLSILSESEYQHFLISLNTVNKQMSLDIFRLERNFFLEQYGHLRPGTYDILSPRYDEAPDNYFNWESTVPDNFPEEIQFKLTLSQLNQINKLLRKHELSVEVIELFNFIKQAIEGREYSKFVFTKNLSDILKLLGQWGEQMGFSTEELSYLNIEVVKNLYALSGNPAHILKANIEEGKKSYEITKALKLPPLFTEITEINSFYLPPTEPNYITLNRVIGEVCSIEQPLEKLSKSLIFIPNADPGYDWLFSHKIGGLITMYGGGNSHMAIRAGELNIPAVIGCGEALYHQWSKAQILDVDCANKQVRIIR